MGILNTRKRKVQGIGALLLALLVLAGCAGIEPYEPRNNREEGPESGLFTGSEGEFVIHRKADQPKTDSEASKTSDDTVDGEQQKEKLDE
jgi:hypothetical protein